jgi:HAD superfamily hydrolase (TIGR01509 family)
VIRGIIFDCYGVLVHGSLSYLRSLTPEESRQAFNDLAHASDAGFVTQQDYIHQVGELIGKTEDEVRAIMRAQEIKSDEMLTLVQEVKQRYKTALLSNIGRGAVERSFTPHDLTQLFDVVALSSEIGMTKPNIEAYTYVASHLGLLPEECIMIDDTPINVDGARMAGMQGIVFESTAQCRRELKALGVFDA